MSAVGIDVPPAIRAERQRQIDVKRWTAEHDDRHADDSLLIAAMMYYRHGAGFALPLVSTSFTEQQVYWSKPRGRVNGPLFPRVRDVTRWREVPIGWPWDHRHWKPKTPARDFERAGALCLAEIDRRRRADPDCDVDVVETVLRDIVKAYRALVPEVTP